MSKINSRTLFTLSKEDHAEETVKEVGEQGAVGVADTEEVVAPVTPSEDVTEAGDDIGQGTPVEEIGADDKADITSTEVPESEVAPAATDSEMTELLQEGQQASAAVDEIVSEASAELPGGGESETTDVNGNPITPEQGAVNQEEAAAEAEVTDEEEVEAEAKDIHQEAAEADENADENLGEAINDDTIPDADATTDDVSADAPGDESIPGMDDLGEDDDTPLDGAEPVSEEPVADEVGADGITDSGPSDSDNPDDVGDVPSTDPVDDLGDGAETPDAVSEEVPEEAGASADVTDLTDEAPAETEELPATDTDLPTEEQPVEEQVADQNEAADVTAEAASADADQTDFIAGESPEQTGDVPVPEGEEVIAEAAPTEEVAAGDTTTTPSLPDEADETPLEGAEPLDVNAEEDLTPPGVDSGDSDPTAATVEESTTDQTAEDLQDGVADVAEATEEVTEDAAPETPVDESTDEPSDVVVEETDSVDTEAGEVEETDEEANFEDGEVDVKDVDTSTTDEDVEEAMATAAETGEWGESEAKDAEDNEKTIEELQKEKATLEDYRCRIEMGIATEEFSPGLLAYMNETMEPLRKRFKEIDVTTPKRVALEDYSRTDMDLAYRASLESIRGMISRVTTAQNRIAQNVEKWWSRSMVDKVLTRADALDKLTDLTLVQLKDADYSTKDVSGVRGALATDETNLVKAVAADVGMTTDIAVKGIKASEGLQATLIKALNDVIGAGSEADINKALDAVSKLKGTKGDFPAAAFTKGLLGGYKLEIRTAEASNRSDKIEAIGHMGIPVGVKVKSTESSTYKLTKGDLANLLKFAKVYIGLARKLANTTGDRAVSATSQVRTTRVRALPIGVDSRIKGDETGVDALATALKLTAKAHVDLYKFITEHCVDIAEACCDVVKKAIK